MPKPLFIFLALLCCWQSAATQCDSLVSFGPLHIQAVLDGEAGNYSGLLMLRSQAGVELAASLSPLQDASSGYFIAADNIALSAHTLSIGAGKSSSLVYSIQGASQPGLFTGTLELSQQGGGCRWEVPVSIELSREGQVRIVEDGPALSLKTVAPSFLNFLLPASIRQEGINFRVENEGPTTVNMDSFSLVLIGENTKDALTESFVSWENADKNLHASELEMLRFRFRQDMERKLKADQYEGELRVYFKDYPEPLSMPLTLSARAGSFWVIVTLLLGIFLGRLIKDLNKAQGQIVLIRRLLPLRAQAEQLSDKLARKQLWDELDKLEADINGVFSDEARETVAQKFPPLEKKIAQARELEALFERMEEQFKTGNANAEAKQKASQQFRLVRDMIMEGKEAEAMSGLHTLDEMISAETGSSKGFFDELAAPAAEVVKRQLEKLMESLQSGETPQAEGREPGKLEKAFLRVMQALSGVKVTARVRYSLIRPLATLVTFIVLLLLGLNEIYIQAGDTFGADGLLDYLKVFLWGVVSDIFSRSLTSDDAVAAFIGK
ncbi:MAG: hypothetical protein KDC66_22525 [Phaeodactylibacter sp.]|nr:hypothetical protein [Phaeodactylibacter sp.]MCB9272822.1 hypothetical protein [Lewinellaceae bacterium]